MSYIKILFFILLFVHGLIHLFRFVKTFRLIPIQQLAGAMSRVNGILWFTTSLLYGLITVLFYIQSDLWCYVALFSVPISQYLIFTSWRQVKAVTLPNITIMIVAIMAFAALSFNNKYKDAVEDELKHNTDLQSSLLTETDIRDLPNPIKKYLRYTGAINKPKVRNFKVILEGQIRNNEQAGWMTFTSEQYNFIPTSTRLFFMKATMKHLPVTGLHSFKNGDAFMDIRLLSLFKVQYQSGKKMGIAETVTFLNDMCCMAPATLIDERIKWLEISDDKVKAQFTNNNITVVAWLHFNDKGELIKFVSDDRYATTENNTLKRFRWSTPLSHYRNFNGHMLAGYADAIYRYPDGDFTYGNFRVTTVAYNVK